MAMLRPASEMKDSGIEWVGQIPTNWMLARLKDVKAPTRYAIVDGPFGSAISTDDYVDEGVPLIRITNLVNGKVSFNDMVFIPLTLAETLQRSKTGLHDIIIAKTGGTVGKCAINNTVEDGILSSSCVKVTISDEHDYRYFYYLFSTPSFVEALINACTGTTRNTINLKPLSSLNCTVPSLYEQQAIADYLDARCSKIDEIIAEATASIEEYKGLKQAVIFEAVTKGLDKNVPMKESGIEWLRFVPENWNVRRIASIYDESKETGRDDLPILLISIHTGISDREIDDDERDRKVIRSEDKTIYKVVHKNYLAYNMMRAWQGGFGAASVDGLVSPAYVVAMPKIDVNSNYIEYVLRTPNAMEYIRGLSYGVADFRLRLYWPYFKGIKIPFPPLEEQNRIVEYISEQSGKMDALISEKQALIDDLQAYKKSLIYEVVTGKRRVV